MTIQVELSVKEHTVLMFALSSRVDLCNQNAKMAYNADLNETGDRWLKGAEEASQLLQKVREAFK